MKQDAAPLTREFVSSIEIPNANESNLLQVLREAFPELNWRDGEGNFGKIFLAGESMETPPDIAICLLCKEPPGPFKLTISLRNAGLMKAEELKTRLTQALPTPIVEPDSFRAFLNSLPPRPGDSMPWVNAPPPQEPRPVAPLLPAKRTGDCGTVELKIPVARPCVAIFQHGVEILISKALLQAMAARSAELATRSNALEEQERLEMIAGARARAILNAAVPAGTDGNDQVPLASLPNDARYVLGQILEDGLAEVVHFTRDGQAMAVKQIEVTHSAVRAGPTAGFGMVWFSIPLGPQILGLNTWVS